MRKEELKNLLDRYSKVNLGNFPTPILRIKNFEEKNGLSNMYIKRDELSENPGGNKIRHMEYLLGDAINNGYDSFIISGPIQSNFCTVACLACKRYNFPCYILHNSEKPEKAVGNNLLNELMGANQLFLGDMSFEELADEVFKLGEELKLKGQKPYVFHTDYTKAIAALGYVECLLEIYEQNESENYNIEDIFVPVGNGIFAAGVVYGNALLGNPFNVRLVSVEFEKDTSEKNIKDVIKNLENLTKEKADIENLEVFDDYTGGGWGIANGEPVSMIKNLAETEGIFLERVYTCKGFYGMVDLLKRGIIKSNGACYIHSGGFPSIFVQF